MLQWEDKKQVVSSVVQNNKKQFIEHDDTLCWASCQHAIKQAIIGYSQYN